jgi:hypothetical protein
MYTCVQGCVGLFEMVETFRLRCLIVQVEATPNGSAYVPSNSAEASSSLQGSQASSTAVGGPVPAKSDGHIAPQSARGVALSQFFPAWLQKVDRRDVAMGAAVVVSAGVLLVWINLYRRTSQL